jgi:hypothetical protein
VRYLRCTIGRWNIDLSSEEAREAFPLINDEGLRVFRSQPGFIRYRLMVAEPTPRRSLSPSGSLRSLAGLERAALQGVAKQQRHSTEVVAWNLRWRGRGRLLNNLTSGKTPTKHLGEKGIKKGRSPSKAAP